MTRATPGALEWEDLDEFVDPDDFAISVQLTTSGAVLRGNYRAVSADGGELGGPTLLCKQVDVDDLSITHGTSLEMDGETRIVAAVRPDGYGMVEIFLDVQV